MKRKPIKTRRTFIKTGISGAGISALGISYAFAEDPEDDSAIPYMDVKTDTIVSEYLYGSHNVAFKAAMAKQDELEAEDAKDVYDDMCSCVETMCDVFDDPQDRDEYRLEFEWPTIERNPYPDEWGQRLYRYSLTYEGKYTYKGEGD